VKILIAFVGGFLGLVVLLQMASMVIFTFNPASGLWALLNGLAWIALFGALFSLIIGVTVLFVKDWEN
jgi:hypothetical protein